MSVTTLHHALCILGGFVFIPEHLALLHADDRSPVSRDADHVLERLVTGSTTTG